MYAFKTYKDKEVAFMKSIWDTEELANHWSLKFEEMQLLKSKPNRSHLAFGYRQLNSLRPQESNA